MSLHKIVTLVILGAALAPVALAGSKNAGDSKSVVKSGTFDQAQDQSRAVLRSGDFGEAGDDMGSILHSGDFGEAADDMGSILHSGDFGQTKDDMGSILRSGRPGEAADGMNAFASREQNLILTVNGNGKQVDAREGQELAINLYVKQWEKGAIPPRTTRSWLLVIDLDGVRVVVQISSPSCDIRVPQLAGRTLKLSAITQYGPSVNEVEVDVHSLGSSSGALSAN